MTLVLKVLKESLAVDSNVGTPSVEVTKSGVANNPTFNFAFHNLKGAKGDKGDKGDTGTANVDDIYMSIVADEDVGLNLSQYKYLNLTIESWTSGNLIIEMVQTGLSYPTDEPLKIELFKKGSSLQWTMFIYYNEINPKLLNTKNTKLYVEVASVNSILFNFYGDDVGSSDYINLFGYALK